MEDLISVVMSTLNTDKNYLDLAINSILGQTYKNIEFIIVCDGSLEEYEYIKEKYTDDRIKLILHEENKGLPYSLNEAIRMSKGKYVARMDSDDISLPDRLMIQKEYMDNNSNIEICGMYARCIGEDDKKCRFYFTDPASINVQLLYVPVLIHPTVMFRKSFFDKNIFYNEEFKCSQDYELWSRASNGKNVSIIREYGLNYRIHKAQAGQSKRELQLKLTRDIHDRNLNKLNVDSKINLDDIKYLLGVLYGYISIDRDNYLKVINIADNISFKSDEGNNYLKRVLYNRIMILMIKKKMLKEFFNRKAMKCIFNFTNFKYFIWYVFGK